MVSGQALEDDHGEPGEKGLFQGMSFWLSHNVPQRSRFKELIQQNGGIVKLNEKDANIQIVDHKKKDLPSNVYSYQFIEKSVQKGILEDLRAYKAGPSTARPVGATHIPARGRRLAYTIQDDQILYDFLQPFERDPTASVSGNKIYQELAAQHPRHTYQSLRDRYLKRLRGHPRPGGMLEPTTASTTGGEVRRSSPSHASTPHPTEAAAQRKASPQKPQEKKRKRSPEPTNSGDRASKSVSSTSKTGAQRPPDIAVPPGALPQRRESPQHETAPSPKKAKAETKPTPAPAVDQETAEKTSIGIDNLFLELPFPPSSPEVDEAPEQDIDSWIENRIRTGKGDEAQIIQALRCTSMDPELADKALDSLVAGKGVPTDMRGVWTAQDDRCMEAQDSREIERVLEKHGSELFNSRWEYLNMARAEGLESQPTA
ncbi:TRF2-interacting telomeric protein/Rap1 C terminal domain-containing protein [Aspergillus aurantiobrunneus]